MTMTSNPHPRAKQDHSLKNGIASSRRLKDRFAAEGVEATVTFLSDPAKFLVFICDPDAKRATQTILGVPEIASAEATTLHDHSILRIGVRRREFDAR